MVKAMLIARRSPDESQFLNDLIMFIAWSGARGGDEIFSVRTPAGLKIPLTGQVVRDQIKDTCKRLGLPPNYLSSHYLRKEAVGASEDDRRDRGNYAPDSQVLNTTYDYATGRGPFASNSLPGGYQPTVTDLRRILPAARPATSHHA